MAALVNVAIFFLRCFYVFNLKCLKLLHRKSHYFGSKHFNVLLIIIIKFSSQDYAENRFKISQNNHVLYENRMLNNSISITI